MEIIGFVISLLALFYLFFKQKSLEQQEYANDMQDEEILKNKVVKKAGPPQPPRVKKSKKHALPVFEDDRLIRQIEKRELKSAVDHDHLKPKISQRKEVKHLMTPSFHPHLVGEREEAGPSKVKIALQRLSNKRDLIIFQEIIDKPKSMRLPP